MRPRLVAVFVLLTAVLGSLLTGATAANAQGSDPVCRMTSLGTAEVICTVPPEADGLRILFIQWTRNGGSLPQFDDIRQILVSCSPGESLMFGVRIGFDGIDDDDPGGIIEGSTQITCPSPPPTVTAFNCSAYGTVTAPFRCDFYWSGGTDPEQVTVSTNGGQGPVTTNPGQNYARVTGSCYPYQITSVTATVTDAAGRRASATRSGFCPKGNN
jgi:hypothetical protein